MTNRVNNEIDKKFVQHCMFFEAKGITTNISNICNLQLILQFISQLFIKDESSYQSINEKW